jgi:hypothetical protein
MDDKRQYSPVAEQAEGSFGQEMKQAITCIVRVFECTTALTRQLEALQRSGRAASGAGVQRWRGRSQQRRGGSATAVPPTRQLHQGEGGRAAAF